MPRVTPVKRPGNLPVKIKAVDDHLADQIML